MNGKGAATAGKEFTLFISYEDMNDIIKIIKSLEDLDLLIDWFIETLKHERGKQEGRYLGASLATLAVNVTSCFFSSKIYKWKRSKKSSRKYMDNFFSSTPNFKQYQGY